MPQRYKITRFGICEPYEEVWYVRNMGLENVRIADEHLFDWANAMEYCFSFGTGMINGVQLH